MADHSTGTPSTPPGDRKVRLLRAASAAAGRGFRVFPLWPLSKHPVDKGWQYRASTDRELITRLWSALPYNIGIACGPLYVLDLDPDRGAAPPPQFPSARHGRDVLARLAEAAGQPYPAHTYRVATPSGGEHLYFTASPHPLLRNTAGVLGWRIDTRGTGGYVVGAGSTLPTGTYQLLDGRAPAPLPEWLVAELTADPLPSPQSAPRAVPGPRHQQSYTRAAIERQCARVRNAVRGQRHTTLVSASASLGRLVAAGLLPHLDAETALRAAAAQHIGTDAFTLHEARQAIHDGLAFGVSLPTGLAHNDRSSS